MLVKSRTKKTKYRFAEFDVLGEKRKFFATQDGESWYSVEPISIPVKKLIQAIDEQSFYVPGFCEMGFWYWHNECEDVIECLKALNDKENEINYDHLITYAAFEDELERFDKIVLRNGEVINIHSLGAGVREIVYNTELKNDTIYLVLKKKAIV